MTDEFETCPKCGTPQLADESKVLVLYFKTKEDRAEFVEVFKELHPSARSYPVGTPEESSKGRKRLGDER